METTATDLPVPEADGAGLFAATIAAHGGDAFLFLSSLTLTGSGTFTSPPQTGGLTVPLGHFTLTLADGGRVRFDTTGIGMSLSFVNRGNGKGGYVVIATRRLEIPAAHCDRIEAFGLLRRAALRNSRVTTPADGMTDTTADGKSLRAFCIHDDAGQLSTVWVETDTRLVRKTVTVTGRGEMTTLLGDYRYVDGVAVFGTMQLRENGGDVIFLRVASITANAPIDDKRFT